MRHPLPSLESLQQRFRARVCEHCDRATALTPGGSRQCEDRCSLFQTIPRLRLVAHCADPLLCPAPRAVAAYLHSLPQTSSSGSLNRAARLWDE